MGKWEKLFRKLGLDGCSTEELEECVMFPDGSHDITDEIDEKELDDAINGQEAEDSGQSYNPNKEPVRTTLSDLAEANRQRALDQTDEENLLLYQAALPEERRELLANNVPDCLSREGAKKFVKEFVATYCLPLPAENKLYLTALRIVTPDEKGRRCKGDLIRMIEKYVPKYQTRDKQE